MTSLHQNDTRPVLALDWSARGLHVTFDGENVTWYDNFEALVRDVATPHQFCTEATFESWDATRRAQVCRLVRAAGHEIYVFRPIHTARARGAQTKTDANDVRIIYALATEQRLHLYPAPDVDENWVAFRTTVNDQYQRLRLAQGKDQLVALALEQLEPYHELSVERQRIVGNGEHYSRTLLAATYFAARHATTRSQFERLLGLHGSAHPSLLRSEIHHHVFRHARKRDVTWTDFRRELRHLYRRFSSHHSSTHGAGTLTPLAGILTPDPVATPF